MGRTEKNKNNQGDKMTTTEIKIGDFVKSWDSMYAERRTPEGSWIEGVVFGFETVEGCKRYQIRVTRDVFCGEEKNQRVGSVVVPPVNGTPMYDGFCDNVELISGN
jgi:hypothetical protein